MAWCPKCKCEYVDGITICADCGCELAESLPEQETQKEPSGEGAVSGGGIPAFAEGEASDEAWEEDFGKAGEQGQGAARKIVYTGVYVNNEERAKENRSSAYTLLLVGSAGLIAVLLVFFDVIRLPLAMTNKYMISGVMGVLFLLFIIMGVLSMRNSRILAGKARSENNLTQEIRRWCAENIRGGEIDRLLSFEEDAAKELKYFGRFEKIKTMIQNQFVNLDEAYLDRLIDEIYPEIFEEEGEET